MLGLLIAGVASSLIDVGFLTLRQRRTDPAWFGRVLSVSISLNVAGFPLGSALARMLIAHSVSATLLAACALVMISAINSVSADAASRPHG